MVLASRLVTNRTAKWVQLRWHKSGISGGAMEKTRTLDQRLAANKRQTEALRQKLKAQAKATELELLFLRQAVTARAVQQGLEEFPQGPWTGLRHNHLCPYCNETWRCDCDDTTYEIMRHGCVEQAEHTQCVAIALSAPNRWQAPYLSRYRKRRGPSSDDKLHAKIVANEAEIARMRAELET